MYRERPVPGGLVWTSRADHPGTTRVIPDGSLDLLWMRGELLVAGPDTGPQLVAAERGEEFTGLRFTSGLGPAILGVPAHELRDRRVPAADLWPAPLVREYTGRLADAADPGAVLTEIAASRRSRPDPIVAAAREARTVAGCAAATGLSERQLHRRSLTAFGYGLKTLFRIRRLNDALAMVRAGTPLADAAALAGYADQPHFTRDARTLTGVPPKAFSPS